ncbi:MAG TPA: hypothetical protein PKH93_06155 [Chitinophagales bacterium]|nr:hypothetical protein [Chitinophagales bacterium]
MKKIITFCFLFLCSLSIFCETTEELLISFENLVETPLHDLEVVESSDAATIYTAKDEQGTVLWFLIASLSTEYIPVESMWMATCTKFIDADYCNFFYEGLNSLITLRSLKKFASKTLSFFTSGGSVWKYQTNYQRVTSFIKFSVDSYDAAQNLKKLIGDFGMSNSCQVIPFRSSLESDGTCFNSIKENYQYYEWENQHYSTIWIDCTNTEPAEIYYWPGSASYKEGYYQKIHLSKDPYLFTKKLDNAVLKACGCD